MFNLQKKSIGRGNVTGEKQLKEDFHSGKESQDKIIWCAESIGSGKTIGE
jgi:hypothetical protein